MTPSPEQIEIDRLEAELNVMYAKRAGSIDSLGDAWCSGCGRVRVYPERGEDTCPDCVWSI